LSAGNLIHSNKLSVINLLIIVGIRKDCINTRRNLLLYLLRSRTIKLVIITEHITATSYIQNFITHTSVWGNSVYELNYLGLLCGFQHNRSTTDQIFCIYFTLDRRGKYTATLHELFIDLTESM